MTSSTLLTLLLITIAAVASPIVVDRLSRWIVIPTIVVELILGVLVGPFVLGWAKVDDIISALSSLGLAVLMFMAGYEIDFGRLRGRPLTLAVTGWLCSLAVGLGIVALRTGFSLKTMVIGLALTTTALGTLLPILRDRGMLGTPFGNRVMAVGAIGEFAPIVAISVVLTTDNPVHSMVLLGVFATIAIGAAHLARQPPSPRMSRLVIRTLHTSAQLAIRLILLVLVTMVWLAYRFELDTLLGSFAAGIVVRLAMRPASEQLTHQVEAKLDAIGFGFLIPIFFVVSGINLNLGALSSIEGLLATALFVLALFVVRGGPIFLIHWRDLPGVRDRLSLALFGASALPLIVVITTIGTQDGVLTTPLDASLVAAGALSILIFPQVAMRLQRGSTQETGASTRDAPVSLPAEPEAL
ncbi:MAG: cation:proton antiporter [Hamadaea sp.]|uniref:cation:proton antiporter n=1 Tax=Hamadaea sp. TaxID=2024425 RepID=UPI00182615C7|nr:cation:proton antiporter [Hamadaea sp.]NUR69615.1 cation:proton antiporter [Hamadaea sp.]NUT24116.1 cation:proton antiporter [Hamadaea sp.]